MSQNSKYQDKEKLTLTMKHFFQISTTACFTASLTNLLSTSATTKSLSYPSHLHPPLHILLLLHFQCLVKLFLGLFDAWLTDSTSGLNPRNVSLAMSAAVEGEGEEMEVEVKAIE